jgi:coatomer subunit beta
MIFRKDDLKHATGEFIKDAYDSNKLNHILQVTGFSDPVYAKAYATVHQYDIVLETLLNLCLASATMGYLRLVERPQNYTLDSEPRKQIKSQHQGFF